MYYLNNKQETFCQSFIACHSATEAAIIAGYSEDLERCFFSINKGLKRRFPWVYTIDDYSEKDLLNIFKKMIKDIRGRKGFGK